MNKSILVAALLAMALSACAGWKTPPSGPDVAPICQPHGGDPGCYAPGGG